MCYAHQNRATAIWPPGSVWCNFSADVLLSPADIGQLEACVHRLMPEWDDTVEPRFFLASLSEEWTPRVVVVRLGDAIAGIVYTKERRVRGFSTGIVYGDGRLGNLAVADCRGPGRGLVVALACAVQAASTFERVRLAIPLADVEARAVAKAQPHGAVRPRLLPWPRRSTPTPACRCRPAIEEFLGIPRVAGRAGTFGTVPAQSSRPPGMRMWTTCPCRTFTRAASGLACRSAESDPGRGEHCERALNVLMAAEPSMGRPA